MRATLERLREYTIAAGRDPAAIGLEPQFTVRDVPEAEWERYFEAWRELGATHFCINTMDMGFTSAQQHIAMPRRVQVES
jgi:hypothetical protein